MVMLTVIKFTNGNVQPDAQQILEDIRRDKAASKLRYKTNNPEKFLANRPVRPMRPHLSGTSKGQIDDKAQVNLNNNDASWLDNIRQW